MRDYCAKESSHQMRDILLLRLRDLRDSQAISVKDLADLLHITPRAYRAIEAGTLSIRISHIEALADFYGTSTDFLLGLTDNPIPPQPK